MVAEKSLEKGTHCQLEKFCFLSLIVVLCLHMLTNALVAEEEKPIVFAFSLTSDAKTDSLVSNRKLPQMGQDKYEHLVLSSFLFGAQTFVAQENLNIKERDAIAFAATTTAAIGVSKELYDLLSKKGVPSFRDLFADFAGIGIGMLLFSFK